MSARKNTIHHDGGNRRRNQVERFRQTSPHRGDLLGERIGMGDIRDVENFVVRCLQKTRLKLTRQEFEEMVSEGFLLLCQLQESYDVKRDPGAQKQRAGGGTEASFAGYAWWLLPRKLVEAWHRLHPEHELKTQEDGKRAYVYREKPRSWEEALEEDPTMNDERVRHVGDFISVPA